jgi:hypothetical protein
MKRASAIKVVLSCGEKKEKRRLLAEQTGITGDYF